MTFDTVPELDAENEPGDMFAMPVPVPANFIDAPELACLAYNKSYAPIIALALERLTYHDAWTGSEADVQRATRQFEHLIGLVLTEDCVTCEPETPEGSNCRAIGPFHPSVEFWPNHPILSPSYHPDNMSEPVWITGAGFPAVDGDDAIINPASIFTPIILTEHWSVGVPSIRLHFSGAGEVTLTFTNAIQGCMAFVFPDGNPLLGDFIDLASVNIDDIIGLGWITAVLEFLTGGFANEVYHKVNFTTSGPHTLTIWFLPVDDEAPFVGFGGGLRRVDYCGEITVEDEPVMAHDLNLDGCTIQLRLDEVVIDTIDLEACIRSVVNGTLQDNNCQLQQHNGTEWQDVPGANYFKTTAECEITNTTTISRPGAGSAANLVLKAATQGEPATDGAWLSWLLRDSTGVFQNAARIVGQWRNDVTKKPGIDLAIYEGVTPYSLLRVAYGTRSIHMFSYEALGHSPSFTFQDLGSNALSSEVLVEAIAASNVLLHLQKRGRMRHWVNHNANNTAVAHEINARSSGVTPGAGFGSGIVFNADSSTTPNRRQAEINAQWTNATDSTRQGKLSIRTTDYLGGGENAVFTMHNGLSAIGFHGVDPIVAPFLSIFESDYDAALNPINDFILQTLFDYGLIDSTVISPDPECEGGIYDWSIEMNSDNPPDSHLWDTFDLTSSGSAVEVDGYYANGFGNGAGGENLLNIIWDYGADLDWRKVSFNVNVVNLVTAGISWAIKVGGGTTETGLITSEGLTSITWEGVEDDAQTLELTMTNPNFASEWLVTLARAEGDNTAPEGGNWLECG